MNNLASDLVQVLPCYYMLMTWPKCLRNYFIIRKPAFENRILSIISLLFAEKYCDLKKSVRLRGGVNMI